MADQETKRYMELQMEELKAAHADEVESSAPKKKNNNDSKNIELAKLYEDAAEYEEELECFQAELEIINAHEIKDIAGVLHKELPDEERDYAKELQAILIASWTHAVEVEKTHPAEPLELIKEAELGDVVQKLSQAFPNYDGSFETSLKELLVRRWEVLIAIKKDHLKEEIDEIYIAGLKPSFVKRIYKQVHGIS